MVHNRHGMPLCQDNNQVVAVLELYFPFSSLFMVTTFVITSARSYGVYHKFFFLELQNRQQNPVIYRVHKEYKNRLEKDFNMQLQ